MPSVSRRIYFTATSPAAGKRYHGATLGSLTQLSRASRHRFAFPGSTLV